MRKIAIIGAGQSGLQLSIGLLHHGFEITLFSEKDSKDLLCGKVMSSQCMFNTALTIERELGLNQWEGKAPPLISSEFHIIQHDNPYNAISFDAELKQPACSVDQRLKIASLMKMFIKMGGSFIKKPINLFDLDSLTHEHDLVIVATGRGNLSSAFQINNKESCFSKPQRKLALTYVNNTEIESNSIRFTLIPDVGEFITFPALTLTGNCEIMTFEAIPGGPLDCFENNVTPEKHLKISLTALKRWFPDEYRYFREATLTDANGYFSGQITPIVRHPILTLPSGNSVLGMGDTLVLNDSITGQGANSAAKCADIYLQQILKHEGDFDPDWMEKTFSLFWDYASHVVKWTNSVLSPVTPNREKIFKEAENDPELASRIVNGFDNPSDFYPWWFE